LDLTNLIEHNVTYGCRPEKLCEILSCSKSQAKKYYNAFWDGNTALNGFKEDLELIYNQRGGKNGGYLVGLDGRKLSIRSPHAMVNTMFQSAGNIVVKTATCLMWNKWVPQAGLDARLVIHQHDEFQAIVHKKDMDEYIKLGLLAFVKAGEYWKINVPIVGDAKIGRNWGECH
jgi:DNA polymerase I-like protein with 3'-5' exonuclease and polymerase domains